MKNKRNVYLALKISYNSDKTTASALAKAFMVFIHNGMGEFPVHEKHGKIEVGEFFVLRDEATVK